MTTMTAPAQSAFRPEPSWDETIVPTLRKRLESESQMLAKRLSTSSIGDEGYTSNPYQQPSRHSPRERVVSPAHSPSLYPKPSSIPRPSLSQSRPSEITPSSPQTNDMTSPNESRYKRSRSHSQPYLYDMPSPNASPKPQDPGSSSPKVNGRPSDTKPKRSPMSPRARSISTSSREVSTNGTVVNGRSESRTTARVNGHTHSPRSPDTPAAAKVSATSLASVNLPAPKPQGSGLLHEPAPFTTPSSFSSSLPPDQTLDDDDVPTDRFSLESEERPFEHWYRGDYARNGGVGELRVGKRLEMLEIASYGHSLRKMPSRPTGYTSGRTSRADTEVAGVGRKRAGSVGARDSLHLDEDEVEDAGRVLDERPLTDLEGSGIDDHTDGELSSSSLHHLHRRVVNGATTSPSLLSEDRSFSAHMRQQQMPSTPSRIPGPRKQQTDPARAPAGNYNSTAIASSSASQLNTPRSRASPTSSPASSRLSPNTHTKRRAKSPGAAAGTSSAKKAKTKTPPRKKQDDSRRSIAEYPYPRGEDVDMADAIPSWTQPKAKGNWDEVVVPVVARKKGMHGLYEQADGNPQQRIPEERDPAPAPGTFGFDYSKYKPPRNDLRSEEIPMDEFGRRNQEYSNGDEDEWEGESGHEREEDNRPVRPLQTMSLNDGAERATSPLPFAHYRKPGDGSQVGNGYAPGVQMMAGANQEKRRKQEEEEDAGGGCCKCVIM